MTHAELVKIAARWLRKRHAVVVTELAGGIEEPDALGFAGHFSTLVECKASRADFRRDHEKSVTRMGDWRYYLVPYGLIAQSDLPAGWGLIYALDRRRAPVVVVKAPQVEDKNWRGEQGLLTSCIRRIGLNAPEGISVKFYTMQTKCRATLGVAP